MFNRRHSFMTRPRVEGPFRRGLLKYIILQYVKEKPSHGYEIIRALEERFHGLYVPSAGTVYPALQMLEEMGYVTVAVLEGKKVYSITEMGQRFLAEHADLQETTRNLWDRENPGKTDDLRRMVREFDRLAELLSIEARNMDSEKLRGVREIIARAREDVEDILRDTCRQERNHAHQPGNETVGT